MTHPPRDLTPLPDLLHGAARAGPVHTRRPVYLDLLPPWRWATYEEMATHGAERFPPSAHRSNA